MEINKIKSITKKQAKAYMVLAYRNIKSSANEMTEQELWDGMEAVMAVYKPKDAVEKVKDTIVDKYRVKQS